MTRGIDPSTDRFLADMTRISRRIGQAQARIASGRRINRPADSPSSLRRLQEAEAALRRLTQTRENFTRIKVETGAAEAALGSALTQLDRVAALGAQGAGTVSTAETRRVIAGELAVIQRQMIGLSNSTAEGRYIFSGDADQTAPFALDPLNAATGVSAYQGVAATRQVEGVDGNRIAIARTAAEIFDDPAASVFAAIEVLRAALEADDSAAIEAALPSVRAAQQHISRQIVFYGAVSAETAAETELTYRREQQIAESLAAIRDADLLEETLALQQARLQHEAALGARGVAPRSSLFDYLG